VLEFELRKARETINALRSELTSQASVLKEHLHPTTNDDANDSASPGTKFTKLTLSNFVICVNNSLIKYSAGYS
jgi:hypothetical protein